MSDYQKYKESHLKAQKKYDDKNREKKREYDKKRWQERKAKYQELEQLQQENSRLKDNWNYIKKMLKEARQEKYISGYCGTCTDIDIDFLLDKMQELQGSDSNE